MKRKSHFHHNYDKLIKYLSKKNLDYQEYNNGYHFKIIGATTVIDLWPSRMKYHIIYSEKPMKSGYHQLPMKFKPESLTKILF